MERIGEVHISTKGQEFKIIEDFGNTNITIQFIDDTIQYNKHYNNIKIGNVINPNFPTIFNKGFIGIGNFSEKLHYIIYNKWYKMLARCYDYKLQLKHPTYIGCSVDKKWYNFQVFAKWYTENCFEDYQLDKDILIKGNKIYSPETCCFVPKQINSLFTKADKIRGNYPIGVSLHNKKYRVKISKYGEQVTYGPFLTIEIAFDCYKKQKEAYIKYIANIWKPKIPDYLYQAMINYKVEITD